LARIYFLQNIIYGKFSVNFVHKGIIIKKHEKGIFESGFLINNIYRIITQVFYMYFGIGLLKGMDIILSKN
jgi:hypothetical protein